MSELDSPEAGVDAGSPARVRLTKALLIWSFIALFAAALVAAGVRAGFQRTAVLKIKSLGGQVLYGGQCDSRGLYINNFGSPSGRWQIRKLIGDDILDFPVAVDIHNSFATRHSKERYLPLITQLPRLRMVSFIDRHLNASELDQLSRLRELKILILSNSINHDSDLSMLKGLQLEWLVMNNTSISDRGLKSLEKITSLKVLDLSSTRVTDQGLRFLEKLPNLKTLSLQRTVVTRERAERFMRTCPHCVVRVGL